MPTLHLRNVPEDVYIALKDGATREGRSLNAEAVAVLSDWVEKRRRAGDITRALHWLTRDIDYSADVSG